jgi:hypothetical protein
MRVAFVDPPWLHYQCVTDRQGHQATLHVRP